MKNLILSFAILLGLTVSNKSFALSTIDGESGNRATDQANCWGFGSFSVSATSKINGAFSYRGNAASSPAISACWIQAPWCKLAAGNITFNAKIDANNGTFRRLIFSYYTYDATQPFGQGALVRFDSITYNAGSLPLSSVSVSVPIPAAIISNTSVYKIMVSAVGSGGNSRWILDDLSIASATYWADPSNSCLPLALIVDADSDGVADADDAYPADASRAYNNFYPAAGFGTLMFEDLWPATGDYDFNDLVVDYRYNLVTNAANKVVEMKSSFVTRAIGASFRNGFAMQFDGLSPSKITQVIGAKYHDATWLNNAASGLENEQTFANIIIFDDAQKVLPSPGGSQTNVIPANARVAPDTTSLTVTFTAASGQMIALGDVVFNPYIIIDQTRGKEVHLPNFAPSSKANTSLFGTLQDDTKPSSGKYYKTANNLPWALNVTTSIPYTHTKNDFITAYLKFADWAQSNGTLYTDWYQNNSGYRNTSNLFVP